jgi:hypothetical protein
VGRDVYPAQSVERFSEQSGDAVGGGHIGDDHVIGRRIVGHRPRRDHDVRSGRSRSAMPLPMPRVPPVTRAVRPHNSSQDRSCGESVTRH